MSEVSKSWANNPSQFLFVISFKSLSCGSGRPFWITCKCEPTVAPLQYLTRCATVCLECSPNTTSGRRSQTSWRPADPSCSQRTTQVCSCSGCLSKQTDGQRWVSHAEGEFHRLAAKLHIFTFVAEKSVQFLFGNNHPQFVAAVDDKYDGVALSAEEKASREAEMVPLMWCSMSGWSVFYL